MLGFSVPCSCSVVPNFHFHCSRRNRKPNNHQSSTLLQVNSVTLYCFWGFFSFYFYFFIFYMLITHHDVVSKFETLFVFELNLIWFGLQHGTTFSNCSLLFCFLRISLTMASELPNYCAISGFCWKIIHVES